MDNKNPTQSAIPQYLQVTDEPVKTSNHETQSQLHTSFNKKVLLLLSVLIGLLIIGLTGSYLDINRDRINPLEYQQATTLPAPITTPLTKRGTPSPQEIDIKEWPVYKSSVYGFSFHYRPDLKIKEEEKHIFLGYDGELNPYDLLFGLSIYIVDNPLKINPETYATSELCKDAFRRPDLNIDTTEYCQKLVTDNLEPYKNNNIDGIRTIYNLYENPMYTIIFPFKDKLMVLLSSGETGGGPTDLGKQTIDKILSTFAY